MSGKPSVGAGAAERGDGVDRSADSELAALGHFTDFGTPAPNRSARRTALVYASLALFIIDLVMILVGFLGGYYLRFLSGLFPFDEFQPLRGHTGAIILQLLIMPVILGASGLYRPVRSVSWLDHFYAVFAGISVGTALNIVVGAFIWKDAPFSRLLTALVWVATITLVMTGRVVIHAIGAYLRQRGWGEERVVIIGSGETADLVLDQIRHSPHTGYRPVGLLLDRPDAETVDGLPVLGTVDQVGVAVSSHQIDTVIIAVPSMSPQQILDIVSQVSRERVNVKVLPDLFQMMTSGVDIGDLNGLPLLSVKDVALRGWNLVLKRSLDLLVSAMVLVVFSPGFLIVAAIIKLTSPGGAFYCQERVGLDGKPFQVIKFRTMRSDAESHSGPVWAHADDPRRTAIGSFLRRSSLDELPQFINVLIGEMSLVGPRPERPYFVEQFQKSVPRYFDRHREKAGITGWAQVNGLRGDTSIEERTAYDLWYVENWSLWLDIKILLMTPLAALRGDNAY